MVPERIAVIEAAVAVGESIARKHLENLLGVPLRPYDLPNLSSQEHVNDAGCYETAIRFEWEGKHRLRRVE